ncbi:SgcJ/EcaC family oxidoreductase [Nocardia cyriacigeorgica]|uniref:SgcJ/EcaC family oxidoreductase n=1 Tax=Nocardia cyriacigeorgica TaxID=135487 RepID=A0A6P1DBJ5_9NOCA|nr:SgcJ/EcaC family oxidoreductase [Nocardia cyriacigeorgica]NEW48106.1 SgcJ/EcaC family oxidoreductase [Nocardia cyriacigeorgica]
MSNAALNLLDRYENAFNTNDADAMNALFWEDSTFINFSGGLVADRDELLAKQRFVFAAGGPLHEVSVRYEHEMTIELTPAVMQIVARQRTRDGVDPARDPMHGVIILTAEFRDDEWRIRTGQNTPVSGV